MSRKIEGPWFRKSKGSWYATVGDKKVSLAVRGEERRAEAVAAWHRLMAGIPSVEPTPPAPPPPTLPPNGLTVRELVGVFLADATARLKPLTVGQYTADLRLLGKAVGMMPVSAVTPAVLTQWVAKMTCGPTTKGVRLRSTSAFFGWAVRMDFLPANPVKKVSKPKERSRGADTVISDADHLKLIGKSSPAFKKVLAVLHGTGCRPGEACRITAADVRDGVAVLHEHKTDGTGRPRLIVLPPDVMSLFKELSVTHPTGPLLRTKHGNPWTGRSITQSMGKLRDRAGVKAMAYGYRHTFATDALEKGVPDATVAALLGHGSTQMLHKHYSHLTSRADALKQAARLIR